MKCRNCGLSHGKIVRGGIKVAVGERPAGGLLCQFCWAAYAFENGLCRNCGARW